MSFDKTATLTVDVTVPAVPEHTETKNVEIGWIEADSEPETPAGYTRFPDADMDFGTAGILYAFMKIT